MSVSEVAAPAPVVPCSGCEKQPDEVNHPVGMIFVGWGRGWETCPRCGGTGVEPKKESER